MSCGSAGTRKYVYTGNQVGLLNYVGLYGFVSGGPAGSSIASGTTASIFNPTSSSRRVWERQDATFDAKLLDAAYPNIDLKWIGEIELGPDTVFRFSDRAFYVQDSAGNNRFYDARAEQAPSINVDVGEWLQPNFQVGDVTLTLNNRDGFFNPWLPLGEKFRQWTGAKVTIKVGFGEKYSNYYTLFEGQVSDKQGLSTTRDSVQVKCYDKLEFDQIPLPPRTFSSDNFPDIDESFKGKSVPLVYGDWSEEIPKWGSVPAICTNALEVDPVSYAFKISDLELSSIDSVWLHRGDRAANKPQGPIRLADNVLTLSEQTGEFSIPSDGVVLDEPFYILDRGKAGQGSGLGLITSDNGFNFVEQGVKIGDLVVNGSANQSQVTQENLLFKSTAVGAAGNGIQIQYVLMTPDNTVDQKKCYATKVSSSLIQVGIPQGTDSLGSTVIGIHTAGAIKSAIQKNPDTNAMVRVQETGTVPAFSGYPANTKVSQVRQTVPAGPFTTTGGQDALLSATITGVSNFQLTVTGGTIFSAGDEYSISTVQYKAQKNDKLTVVCVGKPLALVSFDRLVDVSPTILAPTGISIDFDSSYWLTDDSTQTVYNLSFNKEILKSIPYSQIDASITSLSGICATTDQKIWVVDPTHSKVYSYDHEANRVGFQMATSSIAGLGTALTGLTGIAVRGNQQFWLVDKFTHTFYLIDAFASTTPSIIRSFNSNVFDMSAGEITDVCYDGQNGQLGCVDRVTNKFYRIDEITGVLVSSLSLTDVNPNAAFVSGCAVAQDQTIFLLDQGNLAIYNYNDMTDADNNPACIARDLLQKFGGHTYADFDLGWNQTARQLSIFRSRIVVDKTDKMINVINKLLGQFNVVFHLRFLKFNLFWIAFDNFRATGKLVKEKDIVENTFKPEKEFNQYFNSVTANFGLDAFTAKSQSSDTYVSPAAVSFAGKEYNRALDLPNVYRRADLDHLMPLYVRLSAPEPEFIDVTFGFRMIRAQIHDFLTVLFSDDEVVNGRPKKSGRRFNGVPCMIRKMTFDLGPMTIGMKLWSLGNTQFSGWTPIGNTVGGSGDQIFLSNIGRLGRVSPTGTITAHGTSTLTLANVDGIDAEHRTDATAGNAWVPGYKVDLIDGATKSVVQTLTIQSVLGAVVTFVETLSITPGNTVKNVAGFVTGGHYIQYSTYDNQTETQRKQFASFARPETNYPTSRTQELTEQRGGVHSFDDNGQPYVLYPGGFVSY
jgi:hypothetical protein